MKPTYLRCRGDSGQVGGIEVLPFGFLIFVAITLLIANAWGVIDAKLAVTNSAREATRAYVEANNSQQAEFGSWDGAKQTLASYGRDDARATIGRPVVNGGFSRCSRVSITVTYSVPAIAIPFIGGFGNLKPVSSTHSELIDPFRSGLKGAATC